MDHRGGGVRRHGPAGTRPAGRRLAATPVGQHRGDPGGWPGHRGRLGGAVVARTPGQGTRRAPAAGSADLPGHAGCGACRWRSRCCSWCWPRSCLVAPTCERRADPHPPRRRLGGARLRQPGGAARWRRAHGGGDRTALHRGRLRRLGGSGAGQLDRERVPARLRRGDAARRPGRRPVGGAAPLRGRVAPVRHRQRRSRTVTLRWAGRPDLAHRRSRDPGLWRGGAGSALHGAGEPPVQRPRAGHGPGRRRRRDVHRHGDRAGLRGLGAAQLQPADSRARHGQLAMDLPAERPDRHRDPAADLRGGGRHRDPPRARVARPARRRAAHRGARQRHRRRHRLRDERVAEPSW